MLKQERCWSKQGSSETMRRGLCSNCIRVLQFQNVVQVFRSCAQQTWSPTFFRDKSMMKRTVVSNDLDRASAGCATRTNPTREGLRWAGGSCRAKPDWFFFRVRVLKTRLVVWFKVLRKKAGRWTSQVPRVVIIANSLLFCRACGFPTMTHSCHYCFLHRRSSKTTVPSFMFILGIYMVEAFCWITMLPVLAFMLIITWL